MCQIVERSVGDEIQIEQIVAVAQHAPLPGVLVVFYLVKQVIVYVWAHLNERIDDPLGIF